MIKILSSLIFLLILFAVFQNRRYLQIENEFLYQKNELLSLKRKVKLLSQNIIEGEPYKIFPKPKKPLSLSGYYCLLEPLGSQAVFYFNKDDKTFKSWGGTDGTNTFINRTVDAEGTFQIINGEIRFSILRSIPYKSHFGYKRNARVMEYSKLDSRFGEIMSFDFYSSLYSKRRCLLNGRLGPNPWK